MKTAKVAIIGSGSVGSSIAYGLIVSNRSCEIIMNDLDNDLQEGQRMDLEDSTFLSSTKIGCGDLKECGQADIIIVTAGAKQRKGESRDELLKRNQEILKSIIDGMGEFNKKSIWLVVSNPVDRLAYLTQKLTQLPYQQVFGTGTILDSLRLRAYLSKLFDINSNSIHINILGEHGDLQFINWSNGTVGNFPIIKYSKMKEIGEQEVKKIENEVMRKAYNIILKKGSTQFGIASCVSILCDTIINDKKMILPVSVFHPKYQVYLSYPAVVGKNGSVIIQDELVLNEDEGDKLNKIVQVLKKDEI
ncbi:L-lactate dehydrogenase [Neoconidiobolus thromboides FSU 785]|nr:L-lactate dehydrogenase [Neoconidiobolus thromboides FSU 785]